MKRTRKAVPPYAVVRSMKKLWSDIHSARLRRRIPSELLAERALISRSTLHKQESGEYAPLKYQLGNFKYQFERAFAKEIKVPQSWQDAFNIPKKEVEFSRRITHKIQLMPFSLKETLQAALSKKQHPYITKKKGQSIVSLMNSYCFTSNGSNQRHSQSLRVQIHSIFKPLLKKVHSTVGKVLHLKGFVWNMNFKFVNL